MKQFLTFIPVLAFGLNSYAQHAESSDSIVRQLQEVVITARQPTTRLVGSSLVSTIAGSNLSNLGTSLDVLAQLPMIKVDGKSVSVLGKNNVEIYINGRPMRDEHELVQILSSSLKSVELQMAPGAGYTSTTDAVIKITTKRNFVQGLSVTNQTDIRRYHDWSAMDYLSTNYNTGDWELFASGVLNKNNSWNQGTTTETLIYNGKQITIRSTHDNSYPTTTSVAKGGVNYNKDALSFGAYYSFNPERGDFINIGSEWCDMEIPLTRNIERTVRSQGHRVAAYFENRFAERYLVHFDGDFHTYSSKSASLTSYPSDIQSSVKSTDNRQSTLFAGKLYLNFPLWAGNFTVGTQESYTHTSLDYQMLNSQISSYIPSSLTDARQTSAATFATWSRTMGKLSMTAGARYEYVDYLFAVNGKHNDDMSRRHHLLTPDISLGYSFNDESQISISYKMSTVKPSYSQLTGALTYTGRHEIEGGNPALRDERRHDLQLLGMWRDFIVQSNITRSFDAYAFVIQQYPASTLQLLMHPINIDLTSLNLYLIWNKTIGRWTPDLTMGLYRQWLDIENTTYNRPIISYYFNNTFALPKGWTITTNISGSSKGDMGTNRFGATWCTMDASVGKTFLNNSLSVKLSATDIFDTSNSNWTMNTYGIHVDKRQTYDQRGISLNIIYNFQPRQSKYKGDSAAESELNRL